MTTPLDCITLSLLRFMWLILLCHSSIHSAFSSSARDESALFFNEATTLVESNLHPLLNNLVDRDQILRDGRYMQDILNVYLVALFTKWDIADVPNQMSGVVSDLDMARSIWIS